MKENQYKIGIILVNYNSYKHTIECIKSIEQCNYNNFEIYIIDNASADKSKIYLKPLENSYIFYIQNNSNVGFAGGNNIGIDFAIKRKVDFILLLNNDTILDKYCLDNLVKFYKSHLNENIGILSGLILNYYNRDVIWYAGGKISKLKGDAISKYFGEQLNRHILKSSINETFASGCCMFIPVLLLTKGIRMDEKYFLYYEDADFCNYIISKGYKIAFVCDSVIYHKESVSAKKNSLLYVYYFTRNRLIFIKKNIPGMYIIISYMYTFVWLLKKIILDGYKVKYVLMGLRDFVKKIDGKTLC